MSESDIEKAIKELDKFTQPKEKILLLPSSGYTWFPDEMEYRDKNGNPLANINQLKAIQ